MLCLSLLPSAIIHLFTQFIAPLGLPRSSAKILLAKVCVKTPDFHGFLSNGICTGFKRRCHSVFSEVVQKRVRQKRPLSKDRGVFRDTFFSNFLTFFCDFWALGLGSPQGGELPRGKRGGRSSKSPFPSYGSLPKVCQQLFRVKK